jgi:hypothetical protein
VSGAVLERGDLVGVDNKGRSKLTVVPCTIAEANEYIRRYHRHHKPLKIGYFFAQAVADETGEIRGVAITGRPCSRFLEDGWTVEVRRVATDGCPNACSALYAAAWKAAKALGWRKVITYTLPEEGGASLRGAGWKCIGKRGGGSWGKTRPRVDMHPLQQKLRWEVQ